MSQPHLIQVWLEYAYHKHQAVLQWLPTKLAEWVANNMQDKLGFPDKANPRMGWTPAEPNSILQNHMVQNQHGCELTTFRYVEWESEFESCVMSARCCQRDMPKHLFHKMNPQAIPGYPLLSTYTTECPGISMSDDAAPGLLPYSFTKFTLPLQPRETL